MNIVRYRLKAVVLRVCVQELVSEKLNVQQQSVDLDRLSEELEKIGLNREKLLQQEHTLDDRFLSESSFCRCYPTDVMFNVCLIAFSVCSSAGTGN